MEQEKNSLGELMKITMEHIKTMADANTIIGTPIHAEGVTLIPVSRMSFLKAAALLLANRLRSSSSRSRKGRYRSTP